MSSSHLILGDSLFAIGLTSILATGGLNDHGLILLPLILIAFASCAVRHINYYKETKKIY